MEAQVWYLSLLFLMLPAVVLAQNTSCSLSVTVQDPAGAMMPGVKVTLTGESNGLVRSAVTTNDGFFAFPDLTPATFTLSIEAPCAKTYSQTVILISAAKQSNMG